MFRFDFRYKVERQTYTKDGVLRKKTESEAKQIVGQMLPPHLYKQAWIRNREHTRWRKNSDFCSVVLEVVH